MQIQPDDPRSPDVRALLEAHLSFTRALSPPEDMHALDVEALLAQHVLFFSLRSDGELWAVGAVKRLEPGHAEVKSMHTAFAARGRGAGRAMLAHLLETARSLGCDRVSLETGSMEEFAPARALYLSAGFRDCEPFGDYVPSPYSTFMTLRLDECSP